MARERVPAISTPVSNQCPGTSCTVKLTILARAKSLVLYSSPIAMRTTRRVVILPPQLIKEQTYWLRETISTRTGPDGLRLGSMSSMDSDHSLVQRSNYPLISLPRYLLPRSLRTSAPAFLAQ